MSFQRKITTPRHVEHDSSVKRWLPLGEREISNAKIRLAMRGLHIRMSDIDYRGDLTRWRDMMRSNSAFAALCVSTGLDPFLRFQDERKIQHSRSEFHKLGKNSESELSLTWTKIDNVPTTIHVYLLFTGMLADGRGGIVRPDPTQL